MLACGEDEIGDYVEEYVTRQREGEERERGRKEHEEKEIRRFALQEKQLEIAREIER